MGEFFSIIRATFVEEMLEMSFHLKGRLYVIRLETKIFKKRETRETTAHAVKIFILLASS